MSVKFSLLKNGESLSREEFHLRYEAMAENVKAELIKGIVFFRTKVTATHAQSSAKMLSWLGFYSIKNLYSSLANHVTFITVKMNFNRMRFCELRKIAAANLG